MNGDKSSVLIANVNREIVKLSSRFKINKKVNILDINPHPLYIPTYRELNIKPSNIEEVF